MNLHHIFNTKTIQLLLVTTLLFTVSCNKMLDLKPTDQVEEADVFSSVEKLERGVLGVYEGWYPEYTIRIGSLMADECRIGLRNSGVLAAGQNLFRWTYSSGDDEVLAPWKNGYQVIDRVNRLLKGLPKVPAKNETEVRKVNALKGELLAARAYAHFALYQVYAYSGVYDPNAPAVPYLVTADISSQPSRPTSADFFTQLWKDLADAEPLLSENTNLRMGLNAAYALHARAALYTKNNKEAVLYAGKVINQLPLSGFSDFPMIWKDQSNAEVIFKLKRTNISTMRPGDIFYNIAASRILYAPATGLMNQYDPVNDVRYTSWFRTDPSLTAQGDLPEVITKYEGTDGAQNRSDLKIFRTGEMYLIRAEAALYNGDNATAANDLNSLRTARIKGYQPAHFTSTAELQSAILNERYKELPYEGHRYFDLKRLNKPVTRMTEDAQAPYQVLTTEELHYQLPIPQAEVLANPNIRPNNKGW